MKKTGKILIASRNPAKIERFKNLLSKYANEVIGLNDLGITDKPEEKGETAEENAEIKAKYYSKKSGLLAFSEDEALYVDFLPKNKQPGVHVRRINGKDEVNDEKLLLHWEKIISKVSKKKRTGRWHIAYCLATPGGKVRTLALDHEIFFISPTSKVRLPGWPMSSLEGPVEFNKPHSELTEKERERLNLKADREIAERLKELFKL